MPKTRRTKRESDPRGAGPRRLRTGVPGLDQVLGGGLLERNLYLVAGLSGSGKTVLANQIAFSHVAGGGRAVYVTLVTESHANLVSNMSTFEFFSLGAVAASLEYVSGYGALRNEARLERLSELIVEELRRTRASLLVVDGLRDVFDERSSGDELRTFLNRLKATLELMGCTGVLCLPGEEVTDDGLHVMADGILTLREQLVGLRSIRELYVRKFRGSGHLNGAHVFVIDGAGIAVYPRTELVLRHPTRASRKQGARKRFGIRRLDEALGGGLPEGSSTALVGAPGAGKTLLGMQFLAEGARRKERGLYLGFYEEPERVVAQAEGVGLGIKRARSEGWIDMIWSPPMEGYYEPLVAKLLAQIEAREVRRLFIDGLDGFVRAGTRHARFPDILAALVNELRAHGVSIMVSAETELVGGPVNPLQPASIVGENIIVLRYVELRSVLRRLISVIKVRGGAFDPRIRGFVISSAGLDVASDFDRAEAVLSGLGRSVATPRAPEDAPRRRRAARP